MYEIRREGGRVIVNRQAGEKAFVVLNTTDEAYMIYRDVPQGTQMVTKVKDLPDEALLRALANAIDLKPLAS